MDTTDSTPRPRRRLGGCLLGGCLTLLALVAIPPVLVLAWASQPGPEPDWHSSVTSHEVPGFADAAAAAATQQAPAAASPEATPGSDAAADGRDAPAADPMTALVPGSRPGRIVLEVAFAELEIVPVPAGSPVRLAASYDRARFDLRERLNETADGWEYSLRFKARGATRFWNHGTSDAAELKLEVPRGTQIELVGDVGMGASELELGGLALTSVDLDLGAGEHHLAFSEPVPEPLRLLRLHSGMGDLTISAAGNASPQRLEVEHGMGQVDVDLRGAWKADGRVDLEIGMGDCRVALPERHQAGGQVVDSDIGMGSRNIQDVADAEIAPGLPRVLIRASGGMGNIDVR